MSESTAGLKASRESCYRSRDNYLECFDRHEGNESKCKKLRQKFESECPASWVAHFIRKHKYEKYKQKLIAEGVLVTEARDEELQGANTTGGNA